jgi:ABC-type transport system involved in multi-copper enzyme maturation permease subunit
MSPIRALFWKEWRQMQWRWIFSLVICCLFVFVGLKTRVMGDQTIVLFGFGICAFLIPLFIAMGLVAEEREQGNLGMQLKLPVAAWKVYVAKMAMGTVAVAIPAIACLIIALMLAGDRETTSEEFIMIYIFAVLFGTVFMVWIVVFSMKRKTQWAAALTGIVILAVWGIVMICDDIFLSSIGRDPWNFLLIITPLGFFMTGDGRPTCITQGILAVILFWLGMKQFSTLTREGK